MIWQTSRFQIDLTSPRVMGIVNTTPDSFSDGGKFYRPDGSMLGIFERCAQLVEEGVDILDIGGESTRPGAAPVSLEDELERVLPVVKHAVRLGVPVSVDTYKPQVMQAVLDIGADIINDIWALRHVGAHEVVSAHPNCGVCLMHMHREPTTMQVLPMDGNVPEQVLDFLRKAAAQLEALGVDASRIVLDPGIGFGKTVAQNFALLARQRDLLEAGYPVLAGWSRKSSLAAIINDSLASVAKLDIADRMVPSVAAAVLAIDRGARVVRVHDVRETVQALKIWRAATPAGTAP
ncbi:MAG: dihydropteroate synthase [Pseudomonadota bacterium]